MPACHAGGPGSIPGRCSSIFGSWREVLGLNVWLADPYYVQIQMVERPHSIRGGPGSIPRRCSSIFGIWREVLGHKHTHIMYRFHSSMVERPHSIRGGPGSIPRRRSSIFGIWREVLGRNVWLAHSIRGAWVRYPDDAVQYLAFGEKYWDVMYD